MVGRGTNMDTKKGQTQSQLARGGHFCHFTRLSANAPAIRRQQRSLTPSAHHPSKQPPGVRTPEEVSSRRSRSSEGPGGSRRPPKELNSSFTVAVLHKGTTRQLKLSIET